MIKSTFTYACYTFFKLCLKGRQELVLVILVTREYDKTVNPDTTQSLPAFPEEGPNSFYRIVPSHRKPRLGWRSGSFHPVISRGQYNL